MSETSPKPKAPAGWYPHPSMVETRRYWDGRAWTDHIAPADAQPPAPGGYGPRSAPAAAYVPLQPENNDSGLAFAGVLTAIFIPFIGVIIGIVLLARRRNGAGVTCLIISVISFAVWFQALTPEPTLTYYGDY